MLDLADGDSMAFITDKASKTTISVKADTLENLLSDDNLDNLTLAKIDIEGAEILALQGASKLLQKQISQVWIMEINNKINNFQHEKNEVVELLEFYGYQLYKYNANENKLDLIDLEQHQGNNVLVIAENAVEFVEKRLKN